MEPKAAPELSDAPSSTLISSAGAMMYKTKWELNGRDRGRFRMLSVQVSPVAVGLERSMGK